jgi:hypothetical protein
VCFFSIIYFISKCLYLLGFLHLNHDLKNEESKQTKVLNRTSPLRNLGTNKEELHTPTSIAKKPEGDGGDMKKKIEGDKVLYNNEAWRKVDIMFCEFSKCKLMFLGKIVEISDI